MYTRYVMQLGQTVSYPSINISDLVGRQLNDVESKNAPKNIFYSGSMELSTVSRHGINRRIKAGI